jgi:hypothetical protein
LNYKVLRLFFYDLFLDDLGNFLYYLFYYFFLYSTVYFFVIVRVVVDIDSNFKTGCCYAYKIVGQIRCELYDICSTMY